MIDVVIACLVAFELPCMIFWSGISFFTVPLMQALKVKNFKSGFAGLAPLRARPGLASGRLRPLPIRAIGLLTEDM